MSIIGDMSRNFPFKRKDKIKLFFIFLILIVLASGCNQEKEDKDLILSISAGVGNEERISTPINSEFSLVDDIYLEFKLSGLEEVSKKSSCKIHYLKVENDEGKTIYLIQNKNYTQTESSIAEKYRINKETLGIGNYTATLKAQDMTDGETEVASVSFRIMDFTQERNLRNTIIVLLASVFSVARYSFYRKEKGIASLTDFLVYYFKEYLESVLIALAALAVIFAIQGGFEKRLLDLTSLGVFLLSSFLAEPVVYAIDKKYESNKIEKQRKEKQAIEEQIRKERLLEEEKRKIQIELMTFYNNYSLAYEKTIHTREGWINSMLYDEKESKEHIMPVALQIEYVMKYLKLRGIKASPNKIKNEVNENLSYNSNIKAIETIYGLEKSCYFSLELFDIYELMELECQINSSKNGQLNWKKYLELVVLGKELRE